MDAPPPSPAFSTVSSPAYTPEKFSNPVSYKLSDDNFLLWQQEALAAIKGHKLQMHLQKDHIPAMYASVGDAEAGKVTTEFANWEQQDNLLLSWLLASLGESIRIRMVGCVFAYQVWEKIEKFFASQTRAKVRQLKLQLRGTKKTSSMNTYLLEIKKVVDQLAAIGAPVSTEEYIESILDGLPGDYNPLVTSIISRLDPYSIEEMEALLMAVEARIEKTIGHELAASQISSPVQANVAQHQQQVSSSNRGGFRGRGGSHFCGRGRSGRGGGRFQQGNKRQCQVCGKFGHLAWDCYHRFNPHFQRPSPSHGSDTMKELEEEKKIHCSEQIEK